jgi:Uma2 family endonuclease
MKYKFDLYEEAGVLEYWIVSQPTKRFYLCSKENQFIGMHPLIEEDTIQKTISRTRFYLKIYLQLKKMTNPFKY